MRQDGIRQLVDALGANHQVHRIIQLDNRSGYAHIPDATIEWAAAFQYIITGSNAINLTLS